MKDKYYVYGYVRLDTNTYFYIGKGKDNRYLRLDNRKQHFMNIFNKVDCAVEILYDNLTEDEAFQLEVDTIYDLVFNEGYSIDIKGIKKNSNGCHLVNCTWGGEGTSGLSVKQSQETIDKRVAKNTGKKRNAIQRQHLSEGRKVYLKNNGCERERLKTLRIGYVTSDETKKKLSEQKRGKKQSQEQIQAVKEGKAKMTEEQIQQWKYKEALALGTHIKCIELDMIFPSLNYAVKYIKSTYNILFNKHSLSKCLKNEFKTDWYGEIEINGELIKLHWEYC